MTVGWAQELGEKFCAEHFPGRQALVYTHPDGHNGSGNIHVHVIINSLRIAEVPLLSHMDRPADRRAGLLERERRGFSAPSRLYVKVLPPAAFGRYKNVFLSDTELAELKAEYPDRWEYYIDRLSCHIASSGKNYQSHAATIYKWAQEDADKKPPKKGIPDYSFKEGESL